MGSCKTNQSQEGQQDGESAALTSRGQQRSVVITSGSWRTAAVLTIGAVFLMASFTTVSGIKCWECNSAYDKRCGDPFNSYTSELVDCDQKNPDMKHLSYPNGTIPVATICRKTVQTVNEETRVIRACGWLENPPSMKDRDCFTRTGTNQVMVYHCACQTDGCNAASGLAVSFMVLSSLAALASVIL